MLGMKRYNKEDGGASFLELVLVLGIMAVLTPVVMKFAFNDLADVRYLNIANQIKQFTKATMAFVASKRGDWKDGEVGTFTAKELSDALGDSGLKDSVDARLLKNSKFRYIKDKSDEGKQEGTLVAYLLIDMKPYGLDFANFRKTLLFVGDNVGYVSDENCGVCVASGRCVCSINGDWADTYYNASGIQGNSATAENDLSYVGDERAMSDRFTAVVRIDDNMLEKEYLSDFYLYRNSQGGDDSTFMYRDFSLGGYDIKNLRDIDADTLSSSKGGRVPYMKMDTATFGGNTDITGSIFFGDETEFDKLTIVGGAKIVAAKINFWMDNFFERAAFEKAVLKQSPLLKSNSPIMNVTGDMDFPSGASVQVQSAVFGGIKDSLFKVNEDDFSGRVGSVDRVSSNMKLQVPNLDVKNLDVKVLTVGQDMISSDGGTVVSSSGVVNSSGNVVIHNILGQTKKVDIFGKIQNFLNQSKVLKSAIVDRYAPAYYSGLENSNGDGN